MSGGHEQFPLGEVSLGSFRGHPATPWFEPGYDLYSFDDGASYRALLAAKESFGRIEVLAFVGDWCPDCQEHLPALARILETIGFPAGRVRVYNLDRSKTFPGGAPLLARWGVRRLPTFVVLGDGAELGRVTERPERSLLIDLGQAVARLRGSG